MVLNYFKKETYKGDLLVYADLLDLNGHALTLAGDGETHHNLEQHGSNLVLNQGTLKVDGSYTIDGAGILQMNQIGDVVTVGGDFGTSSSRSHETMLTSGNFRLGGNFTQTGDTASFATSGNFVMSFTGNQKHTAYFESKDYNKFVTIAADSDAVDYTNSGLYITANVAYNVALGIVDGLQYMLEIPDMQMEQ